jgi:voltage-gated potassium channel
MLRLMREVFRRFRSDAGYERWQTWTDWPLVGLALLFLVVLILPLAEPIPPTAARALDIANLVIWGLFAANYLFLLYLALDRRRYVKTHVLDLLVIAVPFLRPFRLLRLFAIVGATTRRAGGRVVQRVTIFAICAAVVVMATSAVVVYDAERRAPHPSIKTLGDSMWWALSTVTTVGYGDAVPTTVTGRLMAGVLMLTGIALVGVVTAAVAAWFVNVVRTAATESTAPIAAGEADLAAELAEIKSLVTDMRAELAELHRLASDRP